jgi:CheY-like chemotaxis protein
LHCRGEETAREVAEGLNCPLLEDGALIERAVVSSGLKEDNFRRAMYEKESIFNKFSRDRERSAAHLRLAMAGTLMENEEMVYHGFGSHLIPRSITHVLNVCLIAGINYRVDLAMKEQELSEREALALIRRHDASAIRWVDYLEGKNAWEPGLYDVLAPMDKTGPSRVTGLILANAAGKPVQVTPDSRAAVADFVLAARVEVKLAEAGHNTGAVSVAAKGGNVTIRIDKPVIRLQRLENELTELAGRVEGAKQVKVEPGPGFYQADVYRRADFELPSKVLLVDDEREFVQTLSERLMLREIGSAVVHDGEEALRVAAEDEPEVIVLDLKMPGIDGIEVLRRLKRDHPKVEVIILTGHGSERDRDLCLELGAFAYLEKPVDVDELSRAMREAYDRVRIGRE